MAFTKIRNGWKIGWTSMSVIKEQPKLLLFMLLSGLTLVLVVASFLGSFAAVVGTTGDYIGFEKWTTIDESLNSGLVLVGLFIFYLICYTIIIFFNVGLVFCTRQAFKGEKVSIREGLRFAVSRMDVILPWAALAATVGTILRMIEERLGFVGHLITGVIGAVWSIATFFVVPILAFEDVRPIEALKRSGSIIKSKWGESIGVNFSFFLFYVLGYIGAVVVAISLAFIHPLVSVIATIVVLVVVHTTVGAAKTVFLTAAYQHLYGEDTGTFDQQHSFDEMFASK